MMNKKMIAVAVAGALGAPAVAFAQSTVQVFGQLYVNYGPHKLSVPAGSSTGSRPTRDIMSFHDSEIGFKGEEKLFGSLSAWFQCATNFDLSRGNAGAFSTSTTDGWCNRNSGLGFKSDTFGNIFLGNWDTPYKLANSSWRVHGTTGAFGISSVMYGSASQGGHVDSVVAGGPGANQNRNSAFRRQAQQISWHSPNWGGAQIMASTAGPGSDLTAGTSGLTGGKPRLYSLAATWTGGPFYIGGGYEKHHDFGGITNGIGGNDHFWSINGAWTGGPFKIGLAYEHRKFNNIDAVGGDLRNYSVGFHAQWNIVGAHALKLLAAKASDSKGSSATAPGLAPFNSPVCPAGSSTGCVAGTTPGDTGAWMGALVYNYAFSKRTAIDIGYSRLKNNSRGTYAGNAFAGVTGSKAQAFALGVRHTF